MAYRQAEEYYNRRYGPTAVQHHTRYQAPQPAAPSNSHNSGGSFHHNNQRPPPLGGSRRRERAPSFPFSEPHSARSPSYGSGLPVVETHVIPPVPLFCDSGRDHVGHVEGSNYWSDNRFRQETGILLDPLSIFVFVCMSACAPLLCVCVIVYTLEPALPTISAKLSAYGKCFEVTSVALSNKEDVCGHCSWSESIYMYSVGVHCKLSVYSSSPF